MKICFLFVAVLASAACASPRPVLYPNDQYQAAGKQRVQADIDDCIDQGQRHVGPKRALTAATHAGIGAAVGAGLGAIVGGVSGSDAGTAAGAGAAIGGAVGVAEGGAEAATPDEAYRKYVELCLSKKGYEPTGWK